MRSSTHKSIQNIWPRGLSQRQHLIRSDDSSAAQPTNSQTPQEPCGVPSPSPTTSPSDEGSQGMPPHTHTECGLFVLQQQTCTAGGWQRKRQSWVVKRDNWFWQAYKLIRHCFATYLVIRPQPCPKGPLVIIRKLILGAELNIIRSQVQPEFGKRLLMCDSNLLHYPQGHNQPGKG